MVAIGYDDSGAITKQMTASDGSSFTLVYNPGDIAWMLCSTGMVWLMIPGIGFFYSGLLRRKNALSMMMLSMMSLAVSSLQWWFWGYSLTFSDGANAFIGDLRHFALRGVADQPSIASLRIPAIIYCVYQGMFACFTPMIALGAMAERARIGPMLIFVFVWSTIVYDPIACWTWNPNGWSYRLHGLDSAGGTPVHITSGAAALAISIYIGKRVGYNTHELEYLPHNTSYVLLGTALLWFGWFGFNGGSGLSANMRAANAIIVTNLSASVGGLTWMAWDWRVYRKWSAVSFCSGAIAGLVAITPACGYVGSPAAVIFGVVSGTACNFGTQLKYLLYIDECLDIFASHVVGGIVGNLLTGIFAQRSIAAYDGFTDIRGGWLDGNWKQLGVQLADSLAGFAWSFCITTAILWIMDVIPGLNIRLSEEAERQGVDESQQGEYIYDYVEREREILPSIRYPQHQVASLRHRSMWTTQTDIGQDFVTARGDTGTIDDTGPREPMLEMVTVNEAGPSNWNGRAV